MHSESESKDEYKELVHVCRRRGTLKVQEVYSDEDESASGTVTSDNEDSPDTVVISDDG